MFHRLFPVNRISFMSTNSIHTTIPYLKGHSKWQNIRHIKALNDAERAKINQRYVNRIRAAVAEGGGSLNPTVNSTLRSAIDLAIHNEVPKATITTALKKYTESADNANLRRHLFECRLYGKVFTVFAYYTANLAQTKIKINTALRKHNADQTRVKHIFTERGLINAVIRSNINETSMEDDCTTDAIECSANDVEIFDVTNRYVTFFCDADALPAVRMKLAKMGYQIENSDIVYEPSQTVSISKQEQLDYGKFKERLNSIEGFDDIFDNIANDEQHILG